MQYAQQQPTPEPPMLPQTSVQQPSVPSGANSSLPGPSFQTPPQSFGNTQVTDAGWSSGNDLKLCDIRQYQCYESHVEMAVMAGERTR